MNTQPVSYLQTDPKWKGLDYSAKGEKTTIGASGCGPTAMSMVLATWADRTITPKTECAWALKNGYKAPHQGTYYSYFVPAAKRYGLKCKQLNGATIYGNSASSHHATALKSVMNGDYVIACMGKGNWTSSGHYVLVWWIDKEKDIIYINDPASMKSTRTRGSYKLFKSQVKFYWVISHPSYIKVEEDPDMTEAQTRKIVAEELKKAMPGIIADVIRAMPSEPVYNTVDEVPEWARGTVRKLVNSGKLRGTDKGLALSYDLLRMLVIADR